MVPERCCLAKPWPLHVGKKIWSSGESEQIGQKKQASSVCAARQCQGGLATASAPEAQASPQLLGTRPTPPRPQAGCTCGPAHEVGPSSREASRSTYAASDGLGEYILSLRASRRAH